MINYFKLLERYRNTLKRYRVTCYAVYDNYPSIAKISVITRNKKNAKKEATKYLSEIGYSEIKVKSVRKV